jgi:hypothetical protein
MTDSEPSYHAKGSDRDVGTVTRQGNEKFGNYLSDAQTLGADAPGPTSESHSAVHGRKIEIHEVLTTYKRKADGQNEQENRKRLRVQHTVSSDDHKLIDPIDSFDISQFIPTESEEIIDEAHRTMEAKSYRKWNPWGIKAVCETGILQEITWDEVRKPVSQPKDGATWGEKIGFTMTMQ